MLDELNEKYNKMSKFGDEKKVYSFLRGLNEYERGLLNKLVDFSTTIQAIIKQYKIPKKEFCQKVKIPIRKYKDFVSGAYNYDVHSMVMVEHLIREKEKEKLDKQELISIKHNYKQVDKQQ